MRSRRRAAAVLAACLLLAGCAPSPHSSAADVELRVQQLLDATWPADAKSNARPASRPVRFALPTGWGFLMQRCMVERGFEAYEYSRTDGFTNGLNRQRTVGREGLAWYYCGQDFPEFDTVFTRLEQPELDSLYDYYATRLIPCLEAIGVDVKQLPSREEFSDGGEGQAGWWNPYEDSERPTSKSAVDEQFARCPPYPPESQEARR